PAESLLVVGDVIGGEPPVRDFGARAVGRPSGPFLGRTAPDAGPEPADRADRAQRRDAAMMAGSRQSARRITRPRAWSVASASSKAPKRRAVSRSIGRPSGPAVRSQRRSVGTP